MTAGKKPSTLASTSASVDVASSAGDGLSGGMDTGKRQQKDPGPALGQEEEEGDGGEGGSSGGESGFVPPHLKLRGAGEDATLGWASYVR